MHARRFSGKLRPSPHPPFQETSMPALPSSARGWLVAGLLMAASMVSFLDRHIVTLMVGPIERDLGITDMQFALTGGAFGLFYTLAGCRWPGWRIITGAHGSSRRACCGV
jgi:hypothetical protein